MKLKRWYRRRGRDGWTYRRPLRLLEYGDTGRPKVRYQMPRAVSACSGAAWLKWASRAELMPDGWAPPCEWQDFGEDS